MIIVVTMSSSVIDLNSIGIAADQMLADSAAVVVVVVVAAAVAGKAFCCLTPNSKCLNCRK